jgi:aryl-alcohol dehydrogenase-like predicted oxidoreductase
MEYRQLGASGFMVPVLSFGTGTFSSGPNRGFAAVEGEEARRMVDICLDAGLNMFDSADIYSGGASETILGEAIKGRRDKVIISTKGTFRTSGEPNCGSACNVGSDSILMKSRRRLPWSARESAPWRVRNDLRISCRSD